MTNMEYWAFVNSFAPWLSALGTIFAVTVSLYLAMRNESIRLNVYIGVRTLFVENQGPGHGNEYVWLSITNIGRRSATITNLYWRFSPFSKKSYVWLAPRNVLSSQLPVTIIDGQSANYAGLIDDFKVNFRKTAGNELRGYRKYLKRHLAKIYVSTSTGQQFSAGIETGLWDELCKLAEEGAVK